MATIKRSEVIRNIFLSLGGYDEKTLFNTVGGMKSFFLYGVYPTDTNVSYFIQMYEGIVNYEAIVSESNRRSVQKRWEKRKIRTYGMAENTNSTYERIDDSIDNDSIRTYKTTEKSIDAYERMNDSNSDVSIRTYETIENTACPYERINNSNENDSIRTYKHIENSSGLYERIETSNNNGSIRTYETIENTDNTHDHIGNTSDAYERINDNNNNGSIRTYEMPEKSIDSYERIQVNNANGFIRTYNEVNNSDGKNLSNPPQNNHSLKVKLQAQNVENHSSYDDENFKNQPKKNEILRIDSKVDSKFTVDSKSKVDSKENISIEDNYILEENKETIISEDNIPGEYTYKEKKENLIKEKKEKKEKTATKKTIEQKPDYIGLIIEDFKEVHYEVFGFEYVVTNEGKERSAVGKMLALYKQKNPLDDSETTRERLKSYFRKVMFIDDDFIRNNISLAFILNQHNRIKKILKYGTARKKQEGATAEELAELFTELSIKYADKLK